MKQAAQLLLFTLCSNIVIAQTVLDYKVKTSSNQKDRTAIINTFKTLITKQYKQEVVLTVRILNVSNNYAWLMADAQRKDAKQFVFPAADYDCCHVEALLQKKKNAWYIVEQGTFAADVWWAGIWDRHPKVPIAIFGTSYFKEENL
jgi:hypothetical protein